MNARTVISALVVIALGLGALLGFSCLSSAQRTTTEQRAHDVLECVAPALAVYDACQLSPRACFVTAFTSLVSCVYARASPAAVPSTAP